MFNIQNSKTSQSFLDDVDCVHDFSRLSSEKLRSAEQLVIISDKHAVGDEHIWEYFR